MPTINQPHELDEKVAKQFDTLISIYFQWAGTNKLTPGQTLGQFLVESKPIYPQFMLDWMEEKD